MTAKTVEIEPALLPEGSPCLRCVRVCWHEGRRGKGFADWGSGGRHEVGSVLAMLYVMCELRAYTSRSEGIKAQGAERAPTRFGFLFERRDRGARKDKTDEPSHCSAFAELRV